MEVNLLYLFALGAILVEIYRRIKKHYDYFHEKPIPSMASYPLLGSTAPLVLKKISFNNFINKIYNKYPNAK